MQIVSYYTHYKLFQTSILVIIVKLTLMSLQTNVDKWMTLPNMGCVISRRYNVVFSAFIIEAKYDDI